MIELTGNPAGQLQKKRYPQHEGEKFFSGKGHCIRKNCEK